MFCRYLFYHLQIAVSNIYYVSTYLTNIVLSALQDFTPLRSLFVIIRKMLLLFSLLRLGSEGTERC